MAETIRDLRIRVGIEQTGSGLRVPPSRPRGGSEAAHTSAASAAKEDAARIRAAREAARESERSAKEALRSAEVATRAFEKQQQQLQVNTEKARAFGFAAQENFQRAGEGAFRLARGIALLGFDSDKDLRKVLENVAKVQAGFDLFRGTADIIRGVTEGLRLMRAASVSATAAEAARAAVSTASSKSTEKSGVAVGGLAGKLTPLGLALAGASAGWLIFMASLDKGTPSIDRILRRLDDFNDKANAARELERTVSELKPRERPINAAEAERSRAEVNRNLNLASAFVDSAHDSEKRAQGATRKFRNAPFVRGVLGDDSQHHELQNALASQEKALEFTSRAASEQDRLVQARRESLNLLKREQESLSQQLNTARSLFAEKKKELESSQARFGRLGTGDQAFIKALDKRIAGGGKATDDELRRAESLGFSGEFTEREFRKRGQAAGVGDLKIFNDPAREFETAQKGLVQAQKAIGQQLVRNAKDQKKAVDDLIAAVDAYNSLSADFQRLSRKVQKLEADARQAGR